MNDKAPVLMKTGNTQITKNILGKFHKENRIGR